MDQAPAVRVLTSVPRASTAGSIMKHFLLNNQELRNTSERTESRRLSPGISSILAAWPCICQGGWIRSMDGSPA